MNKRVWLNLGLVAVAAVLALVAVIEPGLRQAEMKPKAITLTKDDIRQIQIKRLQEPAIDLFRKNNEWVVGFSVNGVARQFPANPWKVEQLLDAVNLKISSSVAANQNELNKYGLNNPRIVLVLNGHEFQFGETNPINHQRYIRSASGIFLAEENVYPHLISEHKDFVSKGLLPGNPSLIALQLPKMSIKQDASGLWTVTPPSEKATADAMQALVDEWRFAQAMEIDITTKFDAKEQATALLRDGSNLMMKIQRREKNVVIYRPDLQVAYQFPVEAAQRLFEFAESPVLQ